MIGVVAAAVLVGAGPWWAGVSTTMAGRRHRRPGDQGTGLRFRAVPREEPQPELWHCANHLMHWIYRSTGAPDLSCAAITVETAAHTRCHLCLSLNLQAGGPLPLKVAPHGDSALDCVLFTPDSFAVKGVCVLFPAVPGAEGGGGTDIEAVGN